MSNQRGGAVPYQLRTFLGGQSDYEDKGISGSYKLGVNIDPRKQKDTISCQQALKDDLAIGTLTAEPYFIVPSSDGNTYILCYDGKIFRRNSSGTYLLVYTDTHESGHIIGAAEWYSSAGWTYLIWATPTRLNIKKLAGSGYTQTEPWVDANVADTGSWPKTNLTSTTWHTMAIANGALQINNGNVMALVGYDLSYTNNSLALIPGNSAQIVLERGKYGVIGCQSSSNKDESTLFAWDGIGLSWNDKEIIKIGGLNSMIDTEIALAQIGQDGQLYIADFNNPLPFRQIRGGGTSFPDAITAFKGLALIGMWDNSQEINWGGSEVDQYLSQANGIYSVGRFNKNASIILNLEYQMDADAIYSVKTIKPSANQTSLLVGYALPDGTGTSFGIKTIDLNNKAVGIYQSLDLVAPVGTRRYPIPLGRMLEWQRIDLQCQPLPAGCKIECWYRVDKITTGGTNDDGWIQANMDVNNTGGGLQFQDEGKQNAIFFVGQKARVLEVMFILLPHGNNSPEINEANIYFNAG